MARRTAVAPWEGGGPGQVNATKNWHECSDGSLPEVWLQGSGALRLIRYGRIRVRGAIGIEAHRVQCRIHNSEGVILGEERLLVRDSSLYVVDAFHVGKFGANAGISESPVLSDGFLLKIERTKIGERIVAGVVVELIVADEGTHE